MKKLLFAGLACLATAGAVITTSTTEAQSFPKQCIAVTCLACPEGTVADPRPNDCCRCVPRS